MILLPLGKALCSLKLNSNASRLDRLLSAGLGSVISNLVLVLSAPEPSFTDTNFSSNGYSKSLSAVAPGGKGY
ncbi:hypothetical protein SAMN02745150_00553 [Brevinema andersonii]|uniref:Uncharacterized protein n=1 Tax=Brevinema andersonii TaxID=34097 RepID=A0A1I1DPM4_BREAD|nr:hypothetical protein SAMN02745150_00553 [Brevinema andersonii]